MAMVYIFDIDGTLAKGDYNGDVSMIPPNEPILNIALAAAEVGRDKVAIVTARPESLKEGTLKWLKKHRLDPEVFLMRGIEDTRPDHLVRVDQVRNVMKELGNNAILLDDKPLNCSAVKKSLGIPVIHIK